MAASKTRQDYLSKGICPGCKSRQLETDRSRCRVCLDREATGAINRRRNPEEAQKQRDAQKLWRQINKDAEKLRHKKSGHGIKVEVINHYGGRCACCGESGVPFLSIDHKFGNGAEHRRDNSGGARRTGSGQPFYYWIKRNNFPDFLQVLCHNCNVAKGTGEMCPHQIVIPLPNQLLLFAETL